jgi:hypothetical protein
MLALVLGRGRQHHGGARKWPLCSRFSAGHRGTTGIRVNAGAFTCSTSSRAIIGSVPRLQGYDATLQRHYCEANSGLVAGGKPTWYWPFVTAGALVASVQLA